MKIGTMTWLHNGNYGSILQAYALQKFLISNGYDNTLINYKPDIKSKIINLIKNRNSLLLFIEKLEANKVKMACTDLAALDEKKKKFESFLNSNCILTEPYTNPSELLKANGMFDTYICGSDQIWSPMLFNPLYYLSYVDNKYKKIAYAPSFGVSKIPKKKQYAISKLLRTFDHISIREQQGAAIVNNFIGKTTSVVLDPTVLLDRDEWDSIVAKVNISTPYILCYFLGEKSEYWKSVEKLANLMNYRIVIIPVNADAYKQKHELMISTGPAEWVNLIKNASLICTDSFHGCLFSIIYTKDFYVFKRFSDKKATSQNSRVYNILNMVGLKNRLIDDECNISKSEVPIRNYDIVQNILNRERIKSKEWLFTALSE